MTLCPRCGAIDWPHHTMEAASIDLHGACLWCRYGPIHEHEGTEEELRAVRAEYERRQQITHREKWPA